MKNQLKNLLPDFYVILFFIVLSVSYFFQPLMEGKRLNQHDSIAGKGMVQEAKKHIETTGETTRWTNAAFGGMPTYQICPSYNSTNLVKRIQQIYQLFLPDVAGLIFIMLIGFYILLRSFGLKPTTALLGAIGYGLSSYFFIIIQAGHIWKFIVLAYIPPTIAGIVLCYRKHYLWGGIVTTFFLTMQILSNHVQMTYYSLFIILALVIAYFVDACQKKELSHFFKASGILVIAAIIGVMINSSTLYHTYKYSQQSMRGNSELTLQNNKENATKNGLNRDYIVQWSYGINETLSLLVPNINGGASIPLSKDKNAMKKAIPQYRQIYQYFTQYFGKQPGTSGPVYVGAFIMMLFILGLFIVKGPLKWGLFSVTLLAIFLSWGQNWMGLTNFFLDYVPMYNKFRAVSSILVIAQFTIPLLGALALKEVMQKPMILRENKLAIAVSFGLPALICLILAIAPSIIVNFFNGSDNKILNAILSQSEGGNQLFATISNNIIEMRKVLVTTDAWRSLIILIIGLGLLFTLKQVKFRKYAIAGMLLLCIWDMTSINKRYLNNTHFVEKRNVERTFTPSEADQFILQDKDPNFRVLNLMSDTFNDAITSYWHKSIGGYHAAKLRRYQDMIDYHIYPEKNLFLQELIREKAKIDSLNPDHFKILNMLNTKYFILAGRGRKAIPLKNPFAYGNAWFVKQIKYVKTPDEEIKTLYTTVPLETAIVNTKFKNQIGSKIRFQKGDKASIKLTKYLPNELEYISKNSNDGFAVFSEIYYPDGWGVYIDNKQVEMCQTDYILRALPIPAGEHNIRFTFEPKSIYITEHLAYGAMALLILSIIIGLFLKLKKTNH